jgi:hypothetical protein
MEHFSKWVNLEISFKKNHWSRPGCDLQLGVWWNVLEQIPLSIICSRKESQAWGPKTNT